MPEPPHRRRAHASSSDLERYAGLFAERTRVMRSSAMRDLMAVTARPEVISLAGGLPDTSTFPPKTFAAQMTRIAQESAAEALQYGPTEGFRETVDCIVEVMGAEGMLPDPDDVIVTTGGQQAIDLICKALVDPGDVVICEAPTYPGAIPVFCSYQAETIQIECDGDGMRIDELEDTLERLDLEGRRPKFVYSVPTFQNPAGVTMSLERRRRLVELARSRELLVVEDNPYGLLRFGGEPLPPLYQLDGGDFVIYVGTFSKILSPGIRLGWAVAPPPVMEKVVLGKQAADLCTSTLTQYFVREYFGEGRWREYIESLTEIYRGRRDAMIEALERYFPPQASWTEPEGGLFIWATLPAYIDTSDLLAKALREDVAFVPGQAAYVDGRGRNSMRLNFSASSEDEIREGIRRIGKTIAEQVELYGALTGEPPEAPAPGQIAGIAPTAGERSSISSRRARAGMKVAVLKGGRSLERGVSLRSGARVEDALERLGHEVLPLEADGDLVKQPDRRCARTSPSSPCTVRAARTGPRRSCSKSSASPSPGPASPPARAASTRCSPSTSCARPGSRRRTGSPSTRPPSASSAPPTRSAGLEERLGFPLVVKPSRGGSALGIKFAENWFDVPEALISAFSYDDRVLLERFVDGRELAVSVLGDEPLPVVEAIPKLGRQLRLRSPLRDRPHLLRLPGRAWQKSRRRR